MSTYSKLCHDIDQENSNGIMSQHFESLSRQKEIKYQMNSVATKNNSIATKDNSVATKDNSVVIENSRTMKQSRQRISMLRQTFHRMSRPRKILCHDATFRARNGRQEDFVATKKFYVATNTT